jgi:hypothetical protein
MTVSNSYNLEFHDSIFRDNELFDQVNLNNTRDVTFTDCLFENNQGDYLFSIDSFSQNIQLIRTQIKNNNVGGLSNHPSLPVIVN